MIQQMKVSEFKKIRENLLSSIDDPPKALGDYLFYNSPRIQADFDFVSDRVAENASILDIGAVPPFLAATLSQAGYRDITIADLAASGFGSFLDSNGIKHYDVNLLDGIPDHFVGAYDFVIFNEVLEHLTGDVLSTVRDVCSCVKPGGRIMITTPNLRSLSGLYALIFCHSGLASKPFDSVNAQYLRASQDDGYFGHVREYTAREVVKTVQDLGLEHLQSVYQVNYTTVPRSFQSRFNHFWKLQRRFRYFRAGYCFAARMEKFFPTWRLFGKHLFIVPAQVRK